MNPTPAPASPFVDTSTRTGKIARLPAHIRAQLNQRLLDNVPAPHILSWLNTLPETRQILRDHFQNNPISPQNLSEWRQGGFRESLLRDDLFSHAAGLADTSASLTTLSDPTTLADNLATVLAARYAALLNTWDGEPNPAFESKLKLLRHLTRDILALQKSLHQAAGLRRQRAREDRDQAAADLKNAKTAAIQKLRAGQRAQSHAIFSPSANPLTLIAVEDASTPEEIAHIIQRHQIQPNPTNSTPPPPPTIPSPSSPSSPSSTPIQPNPTTSQPSASPSNPPQNLENHVGGGTAPFLKNASLPTEPPNIQPNQTISPPVATPSNPSGDPAHPVNPSKIHSLSGPAA